MFDSAPEDAWKRNAELLEAVQFISEDKQEEGGYLRYSAVQVWYAELGYSSKNSSIFPHSRWKKSSRTYDYRWKIVIFALGNNKETPC